jgi:predicted RNase H-like HicB family nuclease
MQGHAHYIAHGLFCFGYYSADTQINAGPAFEAERVGKAMMRYFFALVHKEPDSAFGISFPDLPSVFSAADVEDDLTANAIEALRLWAEDETLPIPSSFDEISARPEVRSELASGAFLTRIAVKCSANAGGA